MVSDASKQTQRKRGEQRKMKPSTENPASLYEAGQRRSLSKGLIAIVSIITLALIFVLSDGLVYSINGSSLLSEVFKGTDEVVHAYSTKSDSSFENKEVTVKPQVTLQPTEIPIPTVVPTPIVTSTPTITASPTVKPTVAPTEKPKKKKKEKTYKCTSVKYITSTEGLNVRKKPSTKSRIVYYYEFGERIKVANYNKNWVVVNYKTKKGKKIYGFVHKGYYSSKKPNIKTKLVIRGGGLKTYEDYRCITSRSSAQYKLRLKSFTSSDGIRMCKGRYLIALGSYYTREIGKCVDIVLANGTVIKCVLGDQKADKDTIENHSLGHGGDTVEFLVQTSALSKKARQMGDIGYSYPSWKSKVVKIRLYNKNLL